MANQPCASNAAAVSAPRLRYSANIDSPRTPRTTSSPVSSGSTRSPSGRTTFTSYSGLGRPMLIDRLGTNASPTTGCEIVSVIPHQPIVLTP